MPEFININYNTDTEVSRTMMSIKEYFTSFVSKDTQTQLANGWGWYIDLEINDNILPNRNKFYNKATKHVNIPPTIKEIPSVRSIKSMKNIQESLMFEMDEDYYSSKKKGEKNVTPKTQCMGGA